MVDSGGEYDVSKVTVPGSGSMGGVNFGSVTFYPRVKTWNGDLF